MKVCVAAIIYIYVCMHRRCLENRSTFFQLKLIGNVSSVERFGTYESVQSIKGVQATLDIYIYTYIMFIYIYIYTHIIYIYIYIYSKSIHVQNLYSAGQCMKLSFFLDTVIRMQIDLSYAGQYTAVVRGGRVLTT